MATPMTPRCATCGTSDHGARALPDGTVLRAAEPCPRIIQLVPSAGGGTYRSGCHEIPPGGLSRVMPVMGVRLFYGIMPSGQVLELVMSGRGFADAERRARAWAAAGLFEATFASDRYEIDGRETAIVDRIDLTPAATTGLALQWARAGLR